MSRKKPTQKTRKRCKVQMEKKYIIPYTNSNNETLSYNDILSEDQKMSNLKNLKLIDTIQDIPIHKTSEVATLRKEGLSTKNIQLIEI